jgi:predicted Rossmann fold flavoprotein
MESSAQSRDVVIIGAGAAGLMCAIEAGARGRSVVVIERNRTIGEKIRISGGGRCNFTNRLVEASHFASRNREFCRSALARFTPDDFIAMVERHGIPYHEKKLGQLFCDGSAREIIVMLRRECESRGVEFLLGAEVTNIAREDRFLVEAGGQSFRCASLVVASGGRSIPSLGATDFGYRTAEQFGLAVVPPRPGLVPLTFRKADRDRFAPLSGVSAEAEVSCAEARFRENILFTHRGLSGPAILQLSSYWREGEEIEITLLPSIDLELVLRDRHQTPTPLVQVLEELLPKRLVAAISPGLEPLKPLSTYPLAELRRIARTFQHWRLLPGGTEGFAKAEVTVGGVDTAELSSKTMESRGVPGLYFVGEVVDVTGWLGGYNFQWAWASGFAAGQAV